MALIALFPFFITATALMSAIGDTNEGEQAVRAILTVMPPSVARTLDAPIHEVMTARTGWLLWLGGARRPVDGRQPDRNDPRHPAPRLWHAV